MPKELEQWTTLEKAPVAFKSDLEDPLVRTFLNTIQDYYNTYQSEYWDIDKIDDLLLDIYDINKKELSPTFLGQIMDIVLAKSKPIDMRLVDNAADPAINHLATMAFREIIKDSWFTEMLSWPKWGFFKKLAFWDFFSLMSANATSWMPEFREGNIKQIFFDVYWNKLLTKSWTKVVRCVIVSEYELTHAMSVFPWIEKVATTWRLPSNVSDDESNDEDFNSEQKSKQSRLVEVWICFDISDAKNPKTVTIAWPWASKIPWTEKEGKDYEHFFGKWNSTSYEPYLPVLHFICKPYGKWILNKGLWHLFYKPTKVLASVRNKFVKVTSKNAEPTMLLNTPTNKKAYLERKLRDAETLRANWKPPIVINEVWTWLEWSIQLQSMKTDSVIAEYNQIVQDIKQEAANFWINIDIFASEASKSATAVAIEEQNLSLAIQQFHEVNAKTYEMAWRYAIEIFKKNIKKWDKTPFKFKPEALIDWQKVLIEEEWKPVKITRWEMLEIFKKYDFDIITDSKTGVYPSPLFEERIKTRFINNFMNIWRTDVAEQLMTESANAFWIDIQAQAPQPQAPKAWEIEEPGESPVWELEPLLEWKALKI